MGSPTSQQWNQMFRTYAVCTLFLWLKYFITQMYAVDQNNHPAEDKKLIGDKTNPEDIDRRKRVFGNDLENIPLHVAVFWAAFIVQCFANMSDYGGNETLGLTALIALYTFFRLVFTLCYIFALQPFRSIAFVLANLCVGIAACIMVDSAFNVDTGKFLGPITRNKE